jgi:glycosyltransferase involved in cell wall biosynthesis
MSTARAARPHVCFFAPAAWPVLSRDSQLQSVGGAEVQQVLLARRFVERGLRVTMICGNYGQRDGIIVDGITVLKYEPGNSRIPVLKFFHPRLTNIWRVLRRADADIVYQRTAAAATGIAALFAKWHRRRFVYAAACDLDVSRASTPKLFNRRGGWRSRQLFTLGMKLADVIVCQHAAQEAECRRSYGRPTALIASCHDTPEGSTGDANGYVLWAGTLSEGKRPELFVDLARRQPHLRFRMIGGESSEIGGSERFHRIRKMADATPNLEFIGFVPYTEINSHFDGARVFVNTSEFEGFPNTFLQAWARRIPTVSFCDPGSTFAGQPVVHAAKDMDGMAAMVDGLMLDDSRWIDAGARAHRYVAHVHSAEAAVGAYERLFENLGSTTPGAAAGGVLEEGRSRA